MNDPRYLTIRGLLKEGEITTFTGMAGGRGALIGQVLYFGQPVLFIILAHYGE